MSPSCQAVPRGRGPHWAFGFFMIPLCPQPQFLRSGHTGLPGPLPWLCSLSPPHLLTSLAYDALPHTHCILGLLGVKCLTQAPQALCFLLCYTYHTE